MDDVTYNESQARRVCVYMTIENARGSRGVGERKIIITGVLPIEMRNTKIIEHFKAVVIQSLDEKKKKDRTKDWCEYSTELSGQ